MFMACPQRFSYAHLLKLQLLREPEGLALGSLLHIARMHYYLARLGSGEAIDPVEAMRMAPARIAWCFPKAAILWPRYVEWTARNDSFTALDVEREYEVRIGGRLFTARIDLVYEMGGRVWADDFKTSHGDVRKVAAQYAFGGQMAMIATIGRAVLAPMYGRPFGGVSITAFSTMPSLGDAPAVRRDVLRIDESWRARVVDAVGGALEKIDEAALRFVDPWNWPVNPEACKSERWGQCRYLALCERGKSALGEYVQAVDDATRIAEGSGR